MKVEHELPYHPLREKGYLSIGDWHTTRSVHEVDEVDKLRFFGLTRECVLHKPAVRAGEARHHVLPGTAAFPSSLVRVYPGVHPACE